jgi:hypothetical protein
MAMMSENALVEVEVKKGEYLVGKTVDERKFMKGIHCRPTVWTWRALSLEFARRREGFGGMPIASFFRVVDISFEYRGDAVP